MRQLDNGLEAILIGSQISNALQIEPLTVQELSALTYHPESTVYKHLAKLNEAGYLEKHFENRQCSNGEGRKFAVYSLKAKPIGYIQINKFMLNRLERNLRKEGINWSVRETNSG